MAILSGEEAKKWLAANPNKSYRDLTTGIAYNAQPQQTTANRPGIINLLLSLSRPFRQAGGITGEFGGTISDLIKLASGKEEEMGEDIFRKIGNIALTQEEQQELQEDPLKVGLKSGAGLISYGIPAGAAKGITSVGGRIGSAAARGAGAGTLGGFGYSESGKELESALKGAGLGALMGGALQGVGEGVRAIKGAKISNKLADMSDDLKTTAYKKKIGMAPTAKQGKYDLVRDSMKLANSEGRKITSAEDLYQFSDELFGKYGNTADDMARTFDDMGGTISVDTIKKPILEKIASVKTPELKAPYQNVLNSIDEAVGGAKTISARDLLQLRREWGNLGNWNQLTPTAEQATAKAWEQVYKTANNTLDDTFTKAGLSGFRDINQKLATAIEQQNWARRAMAGRAGQQVWTDMAQDAVMFGTALGGGPGSIAGFLGTKALQSQGENIAARGLDIASKAAAGTAGIPKVLEPILQAGQRAIPAVSGLAQRAGVQPMQQQQVQQTQPQTQGISAINMMLAQGILNGQISAAEANAVLSLLGMGTGTESMTANQSKAQALQTSLDTLKSAWSQTGGGAKTLESLGINIGTGARSLNQAKISVAEDLGRLQSQGVISPTEREEFDKMMPNAWDNDALVQQKFQAIQDRINSYL
jgi:hypothetical protein